MEQGLGRTTCRWMPATIPDPEKCRSLNLPYDHLVRQNPPGPGTDVGTFRLNRSPSPSQTALGTTRVLNRWQARSSGTTADHNIWSGTAG